MTSGAKAAFRPTKSTSNIRQTTPTGKWLESAMPRERFRVTATRGNEPMLLIPIKLGRADDEANLSYEGAEETVRIVFYDDDDVGKVRASNINRFRLRALCEAADVDYDKTYPTWIEDEDDLGELIDALGDKKIPELWTTHRTSTMPSGEETVIVDVRFRQPGADTMAHAGNVGGESRKPRRPSAAKKRRATF